MGVAGEDLGGEGGDLVAEGAEVEGSVGVGVG